ncbi:MAG: hypothetical protein ACRCYX_14070, partial [Dermatophilaceae bacterium]
NMSSEDWIVMSHTSHTKARTSPRLAAKVSAALVAAAAASVVLAPSASANANGTAWFYSEYRIPQKVSYTCPTADQARRFANGWNLQPDKLKDWTYLLGTLSFYRCWVSY